MANIVSEGALSRYFAVFSFLLQLKQQRRVLSLLWKAFRKERGAKNIPERYLRRFLFIRSLADDTLASYESFVCHFCVETCWKSLLRGLAAATSFERLFKVHVRYLNSVLESASFGGLRSEGFGQLQTSLALVSQFRSLVGGLHQALLACTNFEVLELSHFDRELAEICDKLAGCRARLARLMSQSYENFLPLTDA